MRTIDADAISYESIDSSDTGRHEHYYGTGIIAVRKEDIDAMPTIQPEPHWIPVTKDTPDEERECWITPKTTSKVYRGIFTRHYGECHRTGFICDDGFMWLNTALAWMYCEVPEPYKGVTE